MTSSQHRRPATFCAVALSTVLAVPTVADGHDDHGNGPTTATVIALGAPVAGTLGGDGDVDVFRFDLVGQTQVEIRTTGQTDTTGELTDSAGTSLATDENSGPGDKFQHQPRPWPRRSTTSTSAALATMRLTSGRSANATICMATRWNRRPCCAF